MSDETVKEQDEQAQEPIVDAIAADEAVEVEAEVVEEEAEPTVEEQLAMAQQKSAEHLEGWQRARAELANARKRFDKLTGDARINATVDLATNLLPIIDDFELAFANVPEEIAASDWYDGVQMIPRKLGSILEKYKIERIQSVGEPFDPMVHNAIMREETDEHESDTVIKEFQAGYKRGDRILRPAVVAVAA